MTKRKKPEDKQKTGPKPVITEQLISELLDEVSNGSTERACFRKPGRPDWTSWCRYKRENPEIYNQLALAEKDWCAVKEDQVHEIALDDSKDSYEFEEISVDDDGSTRTKTGNKREQTAVRRHQLQIETLTRMMKWKLPERYSEKIQNEHKGEIKCTPVIELVTKETK